MDTFSMIQIIKDNKDIFCDYVNTESSNMLSDFLKTHKNMPFIYFREYLGYIEKLYLQRQIYNLINQNNEDELNSSISDKSYHPESHDNYHLFFKENMYTYQIYLNLLEIYEEKYQQEVDEFNKRKEKYLEKYTGMITFDSEDFEPYEYLHFHNSKCFKEFYEKNKKILDGILRNIKDYSIKEFHNIFDEYGNIFDEISRLVKEKDFESYQVKITI